MRYEMQQLEVQGNKQHCIMKKLLRKFKMHLKVCEEVGISGCTEMCKAIQKEMEHM